MIAPRLWSYVPKNIVLRCCSGTTTLTSVPDYVENSIALNALTKVSEDMSLVNTSFPKTFNFAAYVNSSETLQNLIQLNVNLSKIEKRPYLVEKLMKLDFSKDMIKHIFLLKDFVENEDIGEFITKNPMIFYESIEDLEARLNYLKSKKFTNDQIKRILTKNPYWLMLSSKRIDRRLGYFQGKFALLGQEVRFLSTKQPKLITYNLHHINTNTFVIKEEMGFVDKEIKSLLLDKPKLWMMNQKALLQRFNYFHNVMKIPHSIICQFPAVLMCRNFKVKQRHMFLEQLGRAQYDEKKENYVPITALVENSDIEFCKKYAKCVVNDFNTFLKTL